MWLDEHLRHSRGYGVHSPFLYRIVREAMMPRGLVGSERGLYDALLARGVSVRTARRLQNLLTLEGYGAWSVDGVAESSNHLTIATTECSEATIGEMMEALRTSGGALCLLHEGRSRARKRMCGRLIEEHHSMSASKRAFTLFFSREDLRKQHIII